MQSNRINPTIQSQAIISIANEMYRKLIEEENIDAASELSQSLDDAIIDAAPSIKCALLAFSYKMAKILEQWEADVRSRLPKTYGNLIVTEQEHYLIIHAAAMALIGKLVARFQEVPELDNPDGKMN